MIVMINGSFGVGKTSVATLLHEQLPHSIFFDPEEIGGYVRLVTQGIRSGEEDTDDFQDIELWRTLVVATGQSLYRRYHRPLIVPMTLVNRAYLETMRSGLEAVAPVYHFCLTAPLPVVQQRLIGRGNGPGTWPWQKSEQCVPQFDDPYYAEHIPTEGRTVPEICAVIREKLPSGAVPWRGRGMKRAER